MTHPHEGLQERARSGYDLMTKARNLLADQYEANGSKEFAVEIRTGNLNRVGMGCAISAIVKALALPHQSAPAEPALMYMLNLFAADRYPSALTMHEMTKEFLSTLPQQAATDWFAGDEDSEGNPLLTVRADELEGLRDAVRSAQALASCCMAPGCYSHEEIQEMARATKPRFDVALSTPTSQPPAAETRLREAAQAIRSVDIAGQTLGEHFELFFAEEEVSEEVTTKALDGLFTAMARAALTQPEPTAQQGGDEATAMKAACIDAVRGSWALCGHTKQRIIERLEAVSIPASIPRQSTDEHRVLHNPLCSYRNGKACDYDCARDYTPPAQQAAGEAEAVRLREIAKPFDDLLHWIRQNKPDYLNPAHEVQLENWAYTLGIDEIMAVASLVSATPQPTESFEMRLCEAARVQLQPNKAYIFTVDPDCPQCAASASEVAQPTETQRIVAAEPERSFGTLKAMMADDPEYAWGWHCNLAMPIMDATGCSHEAANKAGAHLMDHLWGIDITKDERFLPSTPAAGEEGWTFWDGVKVPATDDRDSRKGFIWFTHETEQEALARGISKIFYWPWFGEDEKPCVRAYRLTSENGQ